MQIILCSTASATRLCVALACISFFLPCPARAQEDTSWLDPDDWRHWLQTQEVGGRSRDFRTERPTESAGPSDLRRRLMAGGLSLVLPGAGQFYNHQHRKAVVMAGVEAVIWGVYLGFDRHANGLSEDYRNWAGIFASARGEHPESYWQALGRYMDSDAWHDARMRQARAFGDPYPAPPTAAQEWQWRSADHRQQYQVLRADANLAYDRRNKMILFAILNRAFSVYDAVRNGGRTSTDGMAGASTSLLGLDFAIEVSPAFRQPGARAAACWSF